MPKPIVVFVTPNAPEISGGAGLVVRGRLAALRRLGFHVHLIREGAPVADGRVLETLCDTFEVVRRGGLSAAKLARDGARILTRGYSPKWGARTSRALASAVARLKPACVLLDDLRLAEHGRMLKERGYLGRIVLHELNVEHVLLERQRRFTKSLGKRLELSLRVRRFRALEAELAKACDTCIALTDDDRATLAALNPGFDVRWVPPDVDLDRYRPADHEAPAPELLFIGSLNWTANRDGLEWFVREIWPRVKEAVPGATLNVVGRNPPPFLAGDAAIRAPGFVEDERPEYARARAVIVPLRFGSGVRIKILTSLALDRAVVSTRLGAEGIALVDGESVLLGDDAQTFAAQTIRALSDPALTARIARRGRGICLATYAPAVVDGQLREAIFGGGAGAALG